MSDSYNEPFLPPTHQSSISNIGDEVGMSALPPHVIMAEGAKPGEYISRQRARETTKVRICGCIPVHWIMLLCICFLTFGSYWVYDQPGKFHILLF
jgi:hypothetical protein